MRLRDRLLKFLWILFFLERPRSKAERTRVFLIWITLMVLKLIFC